MSLAVRGYAGNTLAAFGYGQQVIGVVVAEDSGSVGVGGHFKRKRRAKVKIVPFYDYGDAPKKSAKKQVLEIGGHEVVEGLPESLKDIVTRELKTLGKPKILKTIQLEHAVERAQALALLEQRLMKEAKALKEFERRLDEEFFILLVAIEEADEL